MSFVQNLLASKMAPLSKEKVFKPKGPKAKIEKVPKLNQVHPGIKRGFHL